MTAPSVQVLVGDCRDVLKDLPGESAHMVCTSPPFWNLRDYNVAGQLGLEESPAAYVEELVAVFREVRRILRKDGTLWLNLGDSYCSSPPGNGVDGVSRRSGLHGANTSAKYRETLRNSVGQKRDTSRIVGLKPKDLAGIPWRVAFALQADGWWLRQDIVWAKKAPMPESVTDRCTRSHEYVFMLTKQERYFYDAQAIAEPAIGNDRIRADAFGGNKYTEGVKHSDGSIFTGASTRNKRDVWTLGPESYPGAHFATMPQALVEPCILAGTSAKGCCPHCLAPWQRMTERTDEPDVTAKGSRFDTGKTGVNGMGRVQPGERFTYTGALKDFVVDEMWPYRTVVRELRKEHFRTQWDYLTKKIG